MLWEEDGSLLLFGSGQGVYDPAGRKWSEAHPLLGIEDMTDNFRVWGDLVVYQSRADANSSGALCGYHLQTGEKTVFLEGIRICYIAEDGIVYYLAEYREDGEDRRAVRAYHIADGTDDHIGDIPASCGWIGTRFYMDGDLLLFGATGVYAFRVDQKNVEPIAITVSNSAIILNVYGGYAYIRHGDGLYKHCLDTKEETKLVEGEVASVYLFDETWVYYRGYGTADLWRVSQDGTVIEKLYQKGK